MAIDLVKKSNRILLGRRYTTDAYGDTQEAFTSVFDINSTEIFTQTSLIPTSSLPFSGSSQNGYYYTTSKTISATATGNDVMRYWYRHPLTRSALTGTGIEVWLFISGSSPVSTNAAEIDPNQQTSFISPKYSTSLISTNNAESTTPGYVVKAVYSADGISFTDIDSTKYNFDYKTGILQFSSSAAASEYILNIPAGRVYLTAYQYVGETLFTKLNSLSTTIPTNSPWLVSGNTLITSQSYNIQATGSLTINGDVNDVFIVKKIGDSQNLLSVSSSGVVQFYVNNSPPIDTPLLGQIYFTSQSLYLGLD